MGSDSYPLFDRFPPHVNQETSRDAAASIRPYRKGMCLKVLACIQSAGTEGKTDDEVEIELGMRHQTASARRKDLVDDGLVVKKGIKRATRSGRGAFVWIATERSA